MNNKISKKIIDQVNEVYKEKNPSTYIKDFDKKKIKLLIDNRKKFLLEKLHLPPRIFKNSELLDLGCGSGQNSIFYDWYGANCTLVEFDKKSFLNTKKLFKQFSQNKITSRSVQHHAPKYFPRRARFVEPHDAPSKVSCGTPVTHTRTQPLPQCCCVRGVGRVTPPAKVKSFAPSVLTSAVDVTARCHRYSCIALPHAHAMRRVRLCCSTPWWFTPWRVPF